MNPALFIYLYIQRWCQISYVHLITTHMHAIDECDLDLLERGYCWIDVLASTLRLSEIYTHHIIITRIIVRRTCAHDV